MTRFALALKTASVIVVAFALSACVTSINKEKEAESKRKLGVSMLVSGNLNGAYVEFSKALQLNPDSKETHNDLGWVNVQLEAYDKAVENFQAALKLDPEYPEANTNLCFVYYLKSKFDKAEAACKEALKVAIYETPEKAYYNLGRIYYKQKRYADARSAFLEALKRFPNMFQAHYAIALTYNAMKDFGNASDSMSSGINFDPRFNGDRSKAEAEFRKEYDSRNNIGNADAGQYLEILHY